MRKSKPTCADLALCTRTALPAGQVRFTDVSYGLSVELLSDVLLIAAETDPTSVRRHLHWVAERIEGELGDEWFQFIEGCAKDWAKQPPLGPPLTVGLDGGYVHASDQKSRTEGWFEVIAGKSVQTEGGAKVFAFVNTYDTKPKRRLYEMLKSQGLQENQQVVFLSDGGDTVRDLQAYLGPESEHLLDWFHVTMRLTVMGQLIKGMAVELKPDEKHPETATAGKHRSRRRHRGSSPRFVPLSDWLRLFKNRGSHYFLSVSTVNVLTVTQLMPRPQAIPTPGS